MLQHNFDFKAYAVRYQPVRILLARGNICKRLQSDLLSSQELPRFKFNIYKMAGMLKNVEQ